MNATDFFRRRVLLLCLSFALTAATAFAQTTQFTYQGRLLDNTMPPTANYDFEFRLFSTAAGGTALGTIQRSNVTVSNGAFNVPLDFGAQFGGTARYLEIAVKPAGGSSLTTLSPRQPITSTPYSIRSLTAANADTAANSNQLGGVAASQYILTTDSRLTDARNPLPDSNNYIQNSTTRQANGSFNIDGTGRADTFNAATQYNLGGSRILSIDGTNNFFAGINAGANNTTGTENAFFGRGAGFANTTGDSNAFFGYQAGNNNTGGSSNSFFGFQAGSNDQFGFQNTFIGKEAGVQNRGDDNTFVGAAAGLINTTGIDNTYIGLGAGRDNTTGYLNTFVGSISGDGNKTGFYNTSLGSSIFFTSNNLSYATAIGAFSRVSTSNTIALGRDDGSDTVVVYGLLRTGLDGTGSTDVCRNANFRLASCSSSLRYKKNVQTYTAGLSIVRQLRPITFNWIEGGMSDVGFAAEEVNEVEPLLATRNEKGEIEGVKYKQISTVLVNAVNEQQTQIETQRKLIEQQQKQIDALKKIVCSQNPQADICAAEQPK